MPSSTDSTSPFHSTLQSQTLQLFLGLALWFTALLGAQPLAAQPIAFQAESAEPIVALFAADDEGFGLVGELWNAERSTPIPIPLVTRSSTVQRAVPDSRGIRLRLENARTESLSVSSIVVRAIAHRDDSQVLVDGEGLVLAGPPTLPRAATAFRSLEGTAVDALPFFARQDGLGLPGPIVVAAPEELPRDHRLILINRTSTRTEGLKLEVPPGLSRTARLLESESELESTISSAVDQLFYASTQRLDAELGTNLAIKQGKLVRGGGMGKPLPKEWSLEQGPTTLRSNDALEILIEAPPVSESSECWTLLVTLEISAIDPPEWAPSQSMDVSTSPQTIWAEAWNQESIGVHKFVHQEGPDLQLDIRPTMGPGLAVGDVEGDGDPDLYLVQGSGREGSLAPTNRLLENLSTPGEFRFRERTTESGTGHQGAGMGALFFDAEGDGDLDLFVANNGPDVLYLNDGRGVFEDVSESAGLKGQRWSAGVAAADSDLDGDLDLYVTSYLVYDESLMPSDEGFDRY